MILRPPRSTRPDTLFPYTTLFPSVSRVKARAKTGHGFGGISWPFDPSWRGLRTAGFGHFSDRALKHRIGSLVGLGCRVRRVDADTLPAQWVRLRGVRCSQFAGCARAVPASAQAVLRALHLRGMIAPHKTFKPNADRTSVVSGTSVSVRVDVGGGGRIQ